MLNLKISEDKVWKLILIISSTISQMKYKSWKMKDGGKNNKYRMLTLDLKCIRYAFASFRKGMPSTNSCSFEGSNEQNNQRMTSGVNYMAKYSPLWSVHHNETYTYIATKVQHLVVQICVYMTFCFIFLRTTWFFGFLVRKT